MTDTGAPPQFPWAPPPETPPRPSEPKGLRALPRWVQVALPTLAALLVAVLLGGGILLAGGGAGVATTDAEVRAQLAALAEENAQLRAALEVAEASPGTAPADGQLTVRVAELENAEAALRSEATSLAADNDALRAEVEALEARLAEVGHTG